MNTFVKPLNSSKWLDYKEDNFILTLADMDLPLYQPFKNNIITRIQTLNNFTYKEPSHDYYHAIINWYNRRHIREKYVEITQQDIVMTPSLLNIIYLLILSQSKQNDGILMTTPVYNYYDKVSKYLKRKTCQSKMYNEKQGNTSRYDINYQDFEEKAKTSKIFLFSNPHNPTGRIWNKRQTQKLVQICRKYNILIISDEILCDLIPANNHSKFYSLVNSTYDNIVVCNSIGKTFNASSLRGGYAIIKNKRINLSFRTIIDNLNHYTNEMAVICTEIFYSPQGEAWLAYVSQIIKENYNHLTSRLKSTLLVVSELQSAYIILISFEGYIKFIQRWFKDHFNPQVEAKDIVSYYLGSLNIKGIVSIYPGPYGILSEIRFTIAVEFDFFKRFVDKLLSSLFQIQYDYRELSPKL